MINYNAEQSRLEGFKPEESGIFWKPKAGQYKVRALSELTEAQPFKEEGKPDKAQVKVDLLINDKKNTWTMSVGKSPASSYGQLVALAIKNGGKLTGLDFIIVVTFDGKKNSYTVVKM